MLETIARLDWVNEPSPCVESPNPGLLGSLVVKRDDLIGALHGSSKVRRLEFILAAEPWASASRWHSVGAIGSGHLVALTAAAERLGRSLDAYLFWQPPSIGVEDNLAFVANGPTSMRYARSRAEIAFRFPRALVPALGGRTSVGIAPGACTTLGNFGAVRAGLELADQVRAGLLEEPDRVYIPLGTGGTAAGVAVGLALAGLRSCVHAVAVVERPLSPRTKVRRLVKRLVSALENRGVAVCPGLEPKLVIRRGWVGRSYGRPTLASDAATAALRGEGVPAEPVYSGKAFACLLADASKIAGQHVVFWFTARGDQKSNAARSPHGASRVAGWRDQLPRRLLHDLETHK